MAHTYKSEGIVLKRWAYKERDKMVRVLTRDFGKVTGRAISSRNITSKLAGHLEPFIYADFFFAKSKTIDIVAGSNTIKSFQALRSSVEHAAAASFLCEVVDRFTQENSVDPGLFSLLLAALERIAESPSANLLMVYGDIIQILEHMGYSLELDACHSCKLVPNKLENLKFYYQLWSIECESCRSVEDVISLSDDALKVLRFLQRANPQDRTRLQLNEAVWKEIDVLIRGVIAYHVDGKIMSEQVLLAVL